MGNLTGQRIDQTYDGLIHTSTEGPVGQNLVTLQDGLGNDLPVQVSTTDVNFTGNVTGDNDTKYDLAAGENLPDATIVLTGSDGTTDTVTLQAGTGIAFNVTGNTIDVSTTGGGGGATYTVNVIQNGLNVDLQLLADAVVVDTIVLQAGGNVTLTQQGQAVVFQSLDTNTTYDYISSQDGANVALSLVPSIGTADTVKLVAGTGITLTDNGLNQVTVAASGGGGSPGLVNGAAPDSLKQADYLTSSPALAGGDQAIAIGNGARATQPQGVAIGDGAEAFNVGAAAIGQYASASGIYSSAWGRTANATQEGSVAFGQQAQAIHAGAVAMGRGVESLYPDVTHVRELMVTAPSGGTGGNGIILLSPNGTAYKITVDNAGTIISTLV